jgi:hypothetical protein
MKEMSSTGMHEIGSPSSKELDDANLARMGKRPVLKVDLPFSVNYRMKLLLTPTSETLD